MACTIYLVCLFVCLYVYSSIHVTVLFGEKNMYYMATAWMVIKLFSL